MSLKKKNDYDVSFRKAIKHLHGLPRDIRMEEIDLMCRQYEEYHGEKPADYFLESMADSILNEELTDSSPDKVSANEYPFLSDRQLSYRKTRGKSKRLEVTLVIAEIDRLYYKDPEPGLFTHDKSEKTSSIEIIPERIYTSYIEPRKVKVSKGGGRGDDLRLWATQVKERDRYQCQNPVCNSRAGIMHAHHIRNYADFPELRDVHSNGITLCEPCHHEFHRRYGKKYTDEGNLKEFFGETRLNVENVPY